MFTGIVSDVGTLLAERDKGDVRLLRIASKFPAKSIAIGASIAIDGICLTVVAKKPHGKGSWFEVEAGKETLARTTLIHWAKGRKLNLERALKAGDELGGHIVSGHVDGVAKVLSRKDAGDTAEISFRVPHELAPYIAKKGSVALDGISLTVNELDGPNFSVFVIPHTLKATHWSTLHAGDRVNVEVDQMARYAARLAEAQHKQ
jgi:riboflavin synthase